MTANELAAIGGALLSVLVEIVPGFSKWYDARDKVVQRDIMIGLLLLASAGVFGLSCAKVLGVILPNASITCDVPGAVKLLTAFLFAVASNQGTYQLVVKRFKRK